MADGEIQKGTLNVMWNGVWVPLGEAEFLSDNGRVTKVISFTPKDFAAAESRKTRTNPNGEERQCDRRDIHDPHEWQAEFGSYFDVYCPGNDGKTP